MSPEAQRIAIAEACGWEGPFQRHHFNQFLGTKWVGGVVHQLVPDYLSDLNAMHEAIASQKFWAAKWSEYVEHLISVATRSNPDWMCRGSAENCIEATAAQRAEAFLHTIGKWDDTK